MTDFAKTPLENQFETQVVGEISSGATTPFDITVKKAISFTPQADGFRIILEPGTSKEEGMIVTAVSGTTWTIGTRGVPVAKGGSDTTTTHGGGSTIIITDTWSTFDDLTTVVNSKLDQTGGTVSSFDLQSSASNFRIRDDAGDMKLTDDNNAETSLSDLTAAAGTDQKARVSSADTTSGFLEDKVTAGDGLSGTITSPAGNEAWDFDIDTTDTAVFVKTSSGSGDEDKAPVLNSSGKLASGFVTVLDKKAGYISHAVASADATGNNDTAVTTNGTPKLILLDVMIGDNTPLGSGYDGYGKYAFEGSTIKYSHAMVGLNNTAITYRELIGTSGANLTNTNQTMVIGTGGNDQTISFSIQSLSSTGCTIRITNTKNGTGAPCQIKVGYTIIV